MGETPRKRKREEEPMASATPPKEVPARSQAPMGPASAAALFSSKYSLKVGAILPRRPRGPKSRASRRKSRDNQTQSSSSSQRSGSQPSFYAELEPPRREMAPRSLPGQAAPLAGSSRCTEDSPG